ncbi:MAG: N-acetyltransferase [Nitrospirae bacterium]|nr:N-acetyltransferase [Nitrospirota bacterium]
MIRPATTSDIPKILRLISQEAQRGEILPRDEEDITKDLPTIVVATNRSRSMIGTCALKIYSPELCEIRSLVVDAGHRGQDWGIKLVRRCLRQARKLGLRRVFALTYRPEFFKRTGFAVADRLSFPQKVWKDCVYCSRFKDCQEIAVIREL